MWAIRIFLISVNVEKAHVHVTGQENFCLFQVAESETIKLLLSRVWYLTVQFTAGLENLNGIVGPFTVLKIF